MLTFTEVNDKRELLHSLVHGKGLNKTRQGQQLGALVGGGEVKRFNFPFNKATRDINMVTLACEEHKES